MTTEESIEAMVAQFHKELQPYVDKVNLYKEMLAEVQEIMAIIGAVNDQRV
jgi:hypothetical protein